MLEWLRKNVKWILVLIAAGVTAFLTAVFKGFQVQDGKRKPKLTPLPESLRIKVREAEEEAMEVRIRAKVKNDVQKSELDKIKAIPDKKERMDRLARLMREL
jgi:hypothetical protein